MYNFIVSNIRLIQLILVFIYMAVMVMGWNKISVSVKIMLNLVLASILVYAFYLTGSWGAVVLFGILELISLIIVAAVAWLTIPFTLLLVLEAWPFGISDVISFFKEEKKDELTIAVFGYGDYDDAVELLKEDDHYKIAVVWWQMSHRKTYGGIRVFCRDQSFAQEIYKYIPADCEPVEWSGCYELVCPVQLWMVILPLDLRFDLNVAKFYRKG